MLVRGVVSLPVARTTPPRVAVLSLTRDRLEYTKHCFGTLREYAGIPFDHYVLDQGSSDGTREWLEDWQPRFFSLAPENIGISRGINYMLEWAKSNGLYDWYVKLDNDCELTTPNTLRDSLQDPNWILSPHIQGLDSPPAIIGEVDVNGIRVGETSILGGIFMAVPAWVYDEYRHAEDNPIWGMDDVRLVEWFRGRGGRVGYMLDYPANHYLTTAGQREDDPTYYARKTLEYNNGR